MKIKKSMTYNCRTVFIKNKEGKLREGDKES